MTSSDNCFTSFTASIEAIDLPKKFTFPFFYKPHPLAKLAAEQLQDYLSLELNTEQTGKMFGVLVVQKEDSTIGFIAAFSGKLDNKNDYEKFVPPVFDMLIEDNFFNRGMKKITAINERVKELEKSENYNNYKKRSLAFKEQSLLEIESLRKEIIDARKSRKEQRVKAQKELTSELFEQLKEKLIQESLNQKFHLKQTKLYWKEKIAKLDLDLQPIKTELNDLKEERQTKSNALQQKLFEQYSFLNKAGESKSLKSIFQDKLHERPPAGAGECAAPKLLQYAFKNKLKPIALAEFWWGKSPKSEVRKHKQYYPACYGKCKPILEHMLEDMTIEDNPFLINQAKGKSIKTIFEDDDIVVISKPEGLLSVPGINVQDSVYLRMKEKYPLASGPLIVHRLDMATSGIMVIAKSKMVHKRLQNQFIKRTVNKKYVALLDGIIEKDNGIIDLPLRGDIDDRPRQLVCYEHGKNAKTEWEKINCVDNKTKVYFHPITGRTHQLRIHASHPLGLNTAIVGDELYGKSEKRLYLHAESISFTHPTTNEKMSFSSNSEF
jgi:tRNA pseudouridine32 synthase/23S rRNA pseudouridine746 synthase